MSKSVPRAFHVNFFILLLHRCFRLQQDSVAESEPEPETAPVAQSSSSCPSPKPTEDAANDESAETERSDYAAESAVELVPVENGSVSASADGEGEGEGEADGAAEQPATATASESSEERKRFDVWQTQLDELREKNPDMWTPQTPDGRKAYSQDFLRLIEEIVKFTGDEPIAAKVSADAASRRADPRRPAREEQRRSERLWTVRLRFRKRKRAAHR